MLHLTVFVDCYDDAYSYFALEDIYVCVLYNYVTLIPNILFVWYYVTTGCSLN
jgi:hypothetical protein